MSSCRMPCKQNKSDPKVTTVLKVQESRTSRSVSVLNDVDVPARNAQGFQGKLRECHHKQRGTARDYIEMYSIAEGNPPIK